MPVQNSKGETCVNLTEIASRWGIQVASVIRYHTCARPKPGRLATLRHGRSRVVTLDALREYEAHLTKKMGAEISERKRRIERLLAPFPDSWML